VLLQPFALVLDLAVGGAWPETYAAVDSGVFANGATQTLKVDYVSDQ
jgi:hypothetical protein